MSRLLFLSLIGFALTSANYNGYQVLRIDTDADKMAVLKELREIAELDFWEFPKDLMVSPEQQTWVKEILDTEDISYKVWIQDIQTLIDNQLTSKQGEDVSTDFYSTYHSYDEINQWVRDKESENPELVQNFLFHVTSYEGRELRGLKISGEDSPDKPVVWFEGGIHAREWISPATVMYITDKLLEDYGKDREVTEFLDTYDLYVHPLMNPDGYEYTRGNESNARMWRKTRSPNDNVNSTCIGTDGNRNFEYEWGGNGSSSNPCSGSYRGIKANSENEVFAISSYTLDLLEEGKTFALFIDFHSYSQLWLTPWSYTANHPPSDPDFTEQMNMAGAACAATEAVHGKVYTYGPCGIILYEAAGNANDFGYGTLGAVYSYVIELRDDGEFGFLLPEDQIIPTGEETYAGIREAFRYLSTVA
ncbi:carboxypeptidase B-like [Glandiceps talaboti]